MEVVTFKDLNWSEIPDQDNPAFDYLENGGGRRNTCLLICKAFPHDSGQYVVIEVPLSGDVIKRGMFWGFKHATIFAEAISKDT